MVSASRSLVSTNVTLQSGDSLLSSRGSCPREPGSSSWQSDGDDHQDSHNDKEDSETDSDPNRNGRELLSLHVRFLLLPHKRPVKYTLSLSCFTDGGIAAQRGEVTCPESHSQEEGPES